MEAVDVAGSHGVLLQADSNVLLKAQIKSVGERAFLSAPCRGLSGFLGKRIPVYPSALLLDKCVYCFRDELSAPDG